ncbi:MAG: hypothetical protein LBR35_00310, partial [Rickettsiales bacterium]|nr:hypothetical protein [Rickettsiales bacterium]
IVANLDFGNAKELTPELKRQLISILMHNCSFNGQKIQILKVIEMSAESLARAICDKDFRALKLPELKTPPQLVNDGE